MCGEAVSAVGGCGCHVSGCGCVRTNWLQSKYASLFGTTCHYNEFDNEKQDVLQHLSKVISPSWLFIVCGYTELYYLVCFTTSLYGNSQALTSRWFVSWGIPQRCPGWAWTSGTQKTWQMLRWRRGSCGGVPFIFSSHVICLQMFIICSCHVSVSGVLISPIFPVLDELANIISICTASWVCLWSHSFGMSIWSSDLVDIRQDAYALPIHSNHDVKAGLQLSFCGQMSPKVSRVTLKMNAMWIQMTGIW